MTARVAPTENEASTLIDALLALVAQPGNCDLRLVRVVGEGNYGKLFPCLSGLLAFALIGRAAPHRGALRSAGLRPAATRNLQQPEIIFRSQSRLDTAEGSGYTTGIITL